MVAVGRWLTMTVVLGTGLVVATPRAAQSSTQTTVDVEQLGPRLGARVPDFSLTDQNGRPHTLRSVMGPKGAMLVFFRSADW